MKAQVKVLMRVCLGTRSIRQTKITFKDASCSGVCVCLLSYVGLKECALKLSYP